MADGFLLFGGAQLAVDATLVRRRAAQVDGVALGEARRQKERVYTELLGTWDVSAEPVWLCCPLELGGLWSHEMSSLVSELARTKARRETTLIRKRAEQAWRFRWGFHLVLCCGQNSGFVDAGVVGCSGG